MSLDVVSSDQSLRMSFLVRWVIVQNKNKMVVALSNALMVFTMRAT